MDQTGIDCQPLLDNDKDYKWEKFLCIYCLTNQFSLLQITDFHGKQMKNWIEQCEQILNPLQKLIEGLELYKQQILQTIDKFLMHVSNQIKAIKEQQNKLKQQCENYNQLSCQSKFPAEQNQQNIMNVIKNTLQCEMKNLIVVSNYEKLHNVLNNINQKLNIQELDVKMVEDNQNLNFSNEVVDKKFDYQLIQQSVYNENSYYCAITFNKNSSLMIAGGLCFIQVFEFKQNQFKEIQQLKGHTNYIMCLQFMKQSNQFISGSSDTFIIVWELNKNNLWQSIQILKQHTSSIYTIILNQNEDILISGSFDQTIKFWQKKKTTWNSKQSIKCSSIVYSVSLNINEDKLIASLHDKQILVIQFQGKEWVIKQKISVEQYGCRLCFINQNQFIFQPMDRQYLLIYNYDEKDQKYLQGAEVKYENKESDYQTLFPIKYIQSIGLIIIKNNQYVHLIKKSYNGQYKVEQSIYFGTYGLFGCISDDGRYIATWDDKSKQLQIRKLVG